MGVVYAAHDTLLDRQVALKVVASDLSRATAADMARLRLLREAQTAARLSHPNVVTVYDVGAVRARSSSPWSSSKASRSRPG